METTYQKLLLSSEVRPKILVVDDQSMHICLVGEIFKSECDVYIAMDGEQALTQCQAILPDLILFDLVMSDMDGHELCRRLKAEAKTKHIPIILITSHRDAATEALGFELGAADVVTKPFDQNILQARVRTQLMLKLQTDRLLASERFMRTLTDRIPGLIAYWNTDLICMFSNASYQEYFGKSPAQMAGLSIRELMGAELFAFNEPMIRGALRGEHQKFERALTKDDGSIAFTWTQYVPDVQDGQVHGFFVLVSDFTQLKHAQLAMVESEQFARSTIDTVPETICVLDKTGVIIAVNQSWRDFYDANYDDPLSINYALGTNYLQLCESASGADATEAPLMAQGLAAVLRGESDLFSLEYPCDSPTEKRFSSPGSNASWAIAVMCWWRTATSPTVRCLKWIWPGWRIRTY